MNLPLALKILRTILDECTDEQVAHVGYVIIDILSNRVHTHHMKLSGYNELFTLRERLREFFNQPQS